MTDRELKQHVQNALDWEPSVDASDIGVSVDEAVATLRRNVPSYAARSRRSDGLKDRGFKLSKRPN
jgi:osmotically-inducible protein OsmY